MEDKKEYIKATIHTTTQGAEALAGVMPALGVESCCVEDPADFDCILASKDRLAWDFADDPPGAGGGEVRVSFWIEKTDGKTLDDLRVSLLKLKNDEQCGQYGANADFGRLWLESEIVRDDWKNKYKESFRTFSPCAGIVVVPPWEADGKAAAAEGKGADAEGKAAAAEGKGADGGVQSEGLRIVIDPGMAFGTGSHETTAMCLARLKALTTPGSTVLDAGTGSGILAIAAALLGAGYVYAVEIDGDAAASAAGNITANGIAGKIALITGDVTASGTLPADVRYDLITANLSCSLLEKLLPVFKGVLADGGAVILSGLLDAQEERALEALEFAGLRAAEIVKDGEWLMIEARK